MRSDGICIDSHRTWARTRTLAPALAAIGVVLVVLGALDTGARADTEGTPTALVSADPAAVAVKTGVESGTVDIVNETGVDIVIVDAIVHSATGTDAGVFTLTDKGDVGVIAPAGSATLEIVVDAPDETKQYTADLVVAVRVDDGAAMADDSQALHIPLAAGAAANPQTIKYLSEGAVLVDKSFFGPTDHGFEGTIKVTTTADCEADQELAMAELRTAGDDAVATLTCHESLKAGEFEADLKVTGMDHGGATYTGSLPGADEDKPLKIELRRHDYPFLPIVLISLGLVGAALMQWLLQVSRPLKDARGQVAVALENWDPASAGVGDPARRFDSSDYRKGQGAALRVILDRVEGRHWFKIGDDPDFKLVAEAVTGLNATRKAWQELAQEWEGVLPRVDDPWHPEVFGEGNGAVPGLVEELRELATSPLSLGPDGDVEGLATEIETWRGGVSKWLATSDGLGDLDAELERRHKAGDQAEKDKVKAIRVRLAACRTELWGARTPDDVDATATAAGKIRESVWAPPTAPRGGGLILDGVQELYATGAYRSADNVLRSRQRQARYELSPVSLARWEKNISKLAAGLILFAAIWAGLFALWATKDTFGSVVDYLNIFAWAVVGPAAVTAALDVWDRFKPTVRTL